MTTVADADVRAAPDPAASSRTQAGPRLGLPLLLAVALVSGLALGTGFAPLGWWPLAPAGVAGLVLAVRLSAGAREATAVGAAFGLSLTSFTINWMHVIDVAATVGLILVVSLWYTLLGPALKLTEHTRWWPLLAAGTWVAVDYAASRFPFGGFGWLRLGYTQVDSPLAGLFPLLGVVGAGLATALIGTTVVWLGLRWSRRRAAGAAALLAVIALTAGLGSAVPPATASGSAAVGWVQGGAPGGGVYGLGPARTITTNQADATAELADDVAAGALPTPDFVVWPENSTDMDPDTDATTGLLVKDAVDAVGTPVLVGSVLEGPGPDERQTASRWTRPDGTIGATYVKRGIVPFGEWIPFRDVLLPLIPQLRYVGAQSVAGTEPGLLDVELADGTPLRLGVLVCYDVIFDPYVHEVAAADVLLVQSSNAMYQGTAQIEQQFAITRARAAELRREVLVVTTSGVSGLIGPEGKVLWRETGPGSAHGVDILPTRTGTTAAALIAGPLELATSVGAVVWLLVLAVAAVRRRRRP
ncbi:apolipoprotein N-acyltransferase [Tessaracoccus rhinocerotis]|uniref:Apolipoprotein N-acyltransferase n=1 Tax=Tessaracoccus rhinocerotis TaxID=1689449 RepID=A0A553JXT2_9ACTN|nr:apolipoprotein N-acyltransferase [Tessaracoccus rhinocerotis]TRY17265.1 apolipoprotein N-acyltransferase [Tessaracoccus rhinocerotis]